jgi:excinuclease UvrABC helicase subunit UvrB
MERAAKELDFLEAARLRDEMRELTLQIEGK